MEKNTIIQIEVSVVVLMKSIILSMDRACSYLSKTPIGFLLKTTTSQNIDCGGGTGGIVCGMVVIVFCCCCGSIIVGEDVLCFIVGDWVLWYYQ